jgi:hypothetical protein
MVDEAVAQKLSELALEFIALISAYHSTSTESGKHIISEDPGCSR